MLGDLALGVDERAQTVHRLGGQADFDLESEQFRSPVG
jgi:hypothetical protein